MGRDVIMISRRGRRGGRVTEKQIDKDDFHDFVPDPSETQWPENHRHCVVCRMTIMNWRHSDPEPPK